MKTVGAYEAKTHLARLLDEVEHGAEITITRHGRVVARLVPAVDRERVARAIESIRALAKGKHATTEEIIEIVREGRQH